MSNKKHKSQEHILMWNSREEIVAVAHPAFIRKLMEDNKGTFLKSPTSGEQIFVLFLPVTSENYPELTPFLKDNTVNTNLEMKLDDTMSASNATTTTITPQKFMADFDSKIKQVKTEAVKEALTIMGNIIDEAAALPTEPEVSYDSSQETRVFSEAEQKAYFAEFNARHRFLQNINVEVMKSNIGETEYTIVADYRGDITVYQYFKCHIRCDLTLANYSDNLVFKDGVWKSEHVENWLGTYYAIYTEWEDVYDKGTEGHDNRALHPENRKEVESQWTQHYHDRPIEAINALMNFDPKGLTDRRTE